MSKKYIDKEEWVERLEEELKSTKNKNRKTYLNILINSIKCQPTIDVEVYEISWKVHVGETNENT